MKTYETSSEAINDLGVRGYNVELVICGGSLRIAGSLASMDPKDFKIDECYRFEEMSDVDNETILYAISSSKHGIKGIIVNAFGTYAETTAGQLATKLS